VSAHRSLAVWVWLLLLAISLTFALRARFTADLSAFLPRAPSAAQQILVDELREGVVSRLMLIGVEGAPPAKLARASQALADRLARAPEFGFVNNGAESRTAADARVLVDQRYLLSPGVTPERFTVSGLRAALEEDLALLASPMSPMVGPLLARDPTGETLRILDRLHLESGPPKRDGVWFSTDGQRALLIAQTRAPGFDLDAQERALAAVRAAFAAALSADNTEGSARLLVTGPGVFAVATRAEIKQDVTRISLLAVLMVCALLLVVFRSWRVLLLTLLPVASGVVAGIAAVSAAFGAVHGVTLGFGATLLGEGVDYAIYLFANMGGTNPQARLGRLWRTLRLGVLTSVCGFSVLLLSDFSGLAQLGMLSATGLLVAFLVTRFVLPSLTPESFRVRPAAALGSPLLEVVQWLPRLRYPLLLVFALSLAGLAWQGGRVWDDRLESLSPISDSDRRLDEQLRRDLGAPDVGQLVVIRGGSRTQALELAEQADGILERLQRDGELSGFESPAQLLPSERTQRARQAALPEADALRRALTDAARGLPFRLESFGPFFDQVAAAKAGPLLDRGQLDGTGLALKLDALLVQRHGAWFAMLPLRGVKDVRRVQAALAELGEADVRTLDLKQEADALYRGYRRQALRFAMAGAGAIAVLLLVSLRSVRRCADVLLPLATAVVVTCAVFIAVGARLGMFHLVGLLLVVGVGSNYTLFFERDTFAAADQQRTVLSLTLCNACTAIGFGLLGLAHAPVLHAIGITVAAGAFLSLVFGAVLRSAA